MKNLQILQVANGFIVRDVVESHMATTPHATWVFANVKKLTEGLPALLEPPKFVDAPVCGSGGKK